MAFGTTSQRILFAAALAVTSICAAQGPPAGGGRGFPGGFGVRGAAQSGPELATPKVFPPPGSYPTTESVYLYSDNPGVEIHYTFDGSNPTAESPVFNPDQLLFIAGLYDGAHGLSAGYTVRAVAMKEGSSNSDVATFLYTIDRKDRTEYVSDEVLPGVRMIRDSENDKMFLFRGTEKAVLIDTGMGQGELRDYVTQYADGLPIEVILTHNHPDHIGQVDQFIEDSAVYIGEADRASVAQRLSRGGVPDVAIENNLRVVNDGDRMDIGGRQLLIVAVPGHTSGSIVILDEGTGVLFSGDAFGSNNPTVPDALWMQSGPPLDAYLSSIQVARAELRGKVKEILTGHNDVPLVGERYLDNLEAAAQSLIDQGESVLVPSYRPAGLLQVVVGDRLTDPNWAGINVNRQRPISAPPEKIATLSNIEVSGASLNQRFTPDNHAYTVEGARGDEILLTPVAMSTRYKSLTVDGAEVKSGSEARVRLTGPQTEVTIQVSSPDGTASTTYTVTVTR